MTIASDTQSYWLNTYEVNLVELENYYHGEQPPKMFTDKQRTNRDFSRLFAPVNICSTVVDEPIGYLANGQVNITSTNPKIQAWGASYFERRIRPVMPNIVRWQGLFGEVYVYLWVDDEGDSRGLKARVIPPIEGGMTRILADYSGEDETELSEATIYYSQALPGRRTFNYYRLEIDAKEIRVFKKAGVNDSWEELKYIQNPLDGNLPIIPFFNTYISDIIPVMSIQDDLNKLHFDIRLSREYRGFPMLSTDNADVAPDVEIGPNRIFTGGMMHAIPAGDLSPMLSQHDSLIGLASTLGTSLALSDRGGGQLSGVALQYLQQQFESKIRGKATQLSVSLRRLLRTAAYYTSVSVETIAHETKGLAPEDIPSVEELRSAEFQVELLPIIPAELDRAANRAMLLFKAGLVDRQTAMSIAGIENAPLVAEKIDHEHQNRDLSATLRKVAQAKEIGIKREKLAELMGFSAQDLTSDEEFYGEVPEPQTPEKKTVRKEEAFGKEKTIERVENQGDDD